MMMHGQSPHPDSTAHAESGFMWAQVVDTSVFEPKRMTGPGPDIAVRRIPKGPPQ
jgi:hypothetical protein